MTERKRLPDERQSINHKFRIDKHKFYLIVGKYEDGTVGEIFLKSEKEGSTLSGLLDGFAIAFSLALQHGTPLKVLCDKFSYTRFEPAGLTGRTEIPIAHSPLDYVARYLALRYLAEKPEPSTPLVSIPPKAEVDEPTDSVGPTCTSCGHIMIRAGKCWSCRNCGDTTGCG